MLNDTRRTDGTVSFRSRRHSPAPVFLLLALLSACGDSTQESTDTLARIGDVTITVEQLRAFETRVHDPERPVDSRTHLQTLIDRELLVQAAEQRGLRDDADVVRRISEDETRELADRMLGQQIAAAQVTQAEIEAAYQQQPGWNEQIRTLEIFVPSQQAAAVVMGLLRQGRDFAEVARSYSVDPVFGVPVGEPRQTIYHAYDRPKEKIDALFALPVGGVTRPVEAQNGYVITAVAQRTTVDLPRVSEGIHDALLAAKRQQLRNSYLRHLKWDFGTEFRQSGMDLVVGYLRGEIDSLGPGQRALPVYEFDGFVMDVDEVLTSLGRRSWPGVTDEDVNQRLSEDHFPTKLMARDARRKGVDQTEAFLAWRASRLGDRMLQRLREKILEERVEVTEEDLQSYYEQNKQRFRSAAWARLRELLVEDPVQAQQLADRVRAGESLQALAAEHSTRNNKDGILEVSTSHTPAYGETWMNAVMNAPVDELRGPIRTTGGYSVFRVLEHHPERFHGLDVERVRNAVARDTRERAERREFAAYLEELRQEHAASIVIDEDAVTAYERAKAEPQ